MEIAVGKLYDYLSKDDKKVGAVSQVTQPQPLISSTTIYTIFSLSVLVFNVIRIFVFTHKKCNSFQQFFQVTLAFLFGSVYAIYSMVQYGLIGIVAACP